MSTNLSVREQNLLIFLHTSQPARHRNKIKRDSRSAAIQNNNSFHRIKTSTMIASTILCLIIPFIHLAFAGYVEPPYFQEYEDLLGSNLLKRCFKREVPPANGSVCRKDPKVCLFGEQTCSSSSGGGNEVQPTMRCNCLDAVWQCQDFECPTGGGLVCPVQDPSAIVPAPICKTDLSCEYNLQTCCGNSFNSTT